MSARRLGPLATPALMLLAALAYLSPLAASPDGVLFWVGGQYSDLLIAHYPSAELIRTSLTTSGEVPLWNPLILGGAPFAADPLAGLFYPPAWLAVLVPGALGFNLLFILHLAWAGWGMAAWVESAGGSRRAGLIAGLAVCGAPKLIGHIGLGHLGLVMAFAWTPWAARAAGAAARAAVSGDRPWLPAALRAGAVTGASFLADPRWAPPLAMAACLWAAVCLATGPRPAGWARRALRAALAGAGAAAGLAAPLALPLAEFARLSSRAALTAAEASEMALPPARLLGILIPDPGGWPEWLAFAGGATLVLAAAGLAARPRRAAFFGGLTLLGLLLALGPATPLHGLAAALPGGAWLRVPARYLLLASVGWAGLAAQGWEAWSSAAGAARARARLAAAAAATGVIGLCVASAASAPARTGPLAIAAAAALLGVVLMHVRADAPEREAAGLRRRAPLVAGVWLVLMALELSLFGRTLIAARPAVEVLSEREGLVGALVEAAQGGRVFSPSYSVPQQTAARFGLERADGVHPLQLRTSLDFLAHAAGFETAGYSVTVPPFPDGDPHADWGPRLDAELLGLLAVQVVASEYALDAPGLEPIGIRQGVHLLSNPSARPRAWVESTDGTWRAAQVLERSANHLSVRAAGPGLLVLSEVAHPGWRARLDGRPATIETAHGLLRAVRLPEGEHRIDLRFAPPLPAIGGVLALSTIGLLLWTRRSR